MVLKSSISRVVRTFALSYVLFILLVPFCSVLGFTITPESVQKGSILQLILSYAKN